MTDVQQRQNFVGQLFTTLKETAKKNTFSLKRIGKKELYGNCPIKIAFKNENDKKAIFRKLKRLNGKSEFQRSFTS